MTGAGYYPASVTDVSPEVIWTVVVGGGDGLRFGAPKQYEALGDGRVIDLAVAVARGAGDGVVVVVPAADASREGGVAGGPTRSASVRAGLAAVPPEATIVCVHDAARPLASEALFAATVAAVRAGADAAVPAVPVADTIKVIDAALVEGAGGRVVTVPGEPWNRKITGPDDLDWARRWLAASVHA